MKDLRTSQQDILRRLSEVESAIPYMRQLIAQKSPAKYLDFYNEKIDYELKHIERTRALALKDDRPPEYLDGLVRMSEYELYILEEELSSYQLEEEVA